MDLIALTDVHKSYRGRHLLRGVSLQIGERERVGLLGPNGCGKSTLLRILAGVEEPDAGTRVLRRDLRLGFLEQEPTLPAAARVRDVVRDGLAGRAHVLAELERVHADLARTARDGTRAAKAEGGAAAGGARRGADGSADARMRSLLARHAELEDALLALGGHDVEHQVEALLDRVGLPDPEAPCGTLSGGEARRAALARVLLGGPDLLLLDEPTNHLDAEVIGWLEEFLLAARTPLLMITHDRYVLERVCERIVELDRGELVSYAGSYGDYLITRAAREEQEARAESGRRNLLRRETAWMRRGPPARTTKAKARIARYGALVESAPEARGDTLAFRIPEGPRLGVRVLRLHGVRKAYDGRVVIPGLDLELGPGERLGIVGPNGAGKSTLLGLCTGALPPDAGKVSIGDSVVFGSIDQKRAALHDERSVLQEVAGENAWVRVGDRMQHVEGFLEQFLFPGAQKHALVGSLSGGERNRVLLAKLLCAGGNVLVLDEPTNDLDLDTLRALEDALAAFPGCALVVSHDRWFLDRVATRVVHLDGKGGMTVHSGDLSGLLGDLATRPSGTRSGTGDGPRRAVGPAPAPAPAPATGTAGAAGAATPGDRDDGPARPKRLAPWEARECDALPDRIAAVEAELAAVDARLAAPGLYQGPVDALQRVAAERARLAAQIEELTHRWEDLESRR